LKLVAFEEAGAARLGVLRDNNTEIVDLGLAAPGLAQDVMGLIKQGQAGFDAARSAAAKAPANAVKPLKGLKFLMPIATPSKIICLGLNYADHAAEGGNKVPEYPAFFLRGQSSLLAHNEPIIRPRASTKLDFEAELAVVIGKRSRHLTAENALAAVAGYSCFNDGSVRDYQRKSSQWTIGKNFDATGGFGPWFVTADALPPGASGLSIQSRLNGQVMQSSNTRNMIVSTVYALQLLSEAMTLEPGDLIVMGTPAGVGYARTPPVWMAPGDTIEIDIEGIGVLSNGIADEA
jgi:2-keto-4-pentenoate hydratase/2-oxohepta-3-ene-1,7-dioic acid hydratase in catechol pathway